MQQLQSFGLPTTVVAAGEHLERSKDSSWKDFFTDPSNWWDIRSSKRGPQQPDFKHKLTQEPLWMDSQNNPSWLADELIRKGFAAKQCPGMANDQGHEDALLLSPVSACCNTTHLPRTPFYNELQKRGLAEAKSSDYLIIIYAKRGELQKAQALLDRHNSSSTIPWTAVIAGYARKGQGKKALDCFEQMKCQGILPNSVTYVCVLKACAVIGAIDKGKKIHDEISRQGLLEHSIVLGNALVNMYAKCGALLQAQGVLQKLPARNVVSWSALIAGYAQVGQGQNALDCYEQMQHEGIFPDVVTYGCILKACAVIGDIDKGKQIHEEILREGLLEHSVMLGGALVNMYVKCGALVQAQSVLETIGSRDVVSWSTLIAGYAQKGQGQQALDCLEKMQQEGISPDAVAYGSILKACAIIGAIDKGKQIHEEISRQGLLEHSVVLGNALVDMYAKCGALPQAHLVLKQLPSRNAVSWNTLITGYAEKGQGKHALDCFEKMQAEGVTPNAVTYVCILKACAVIGAIDKGKQIHEDILRQGLLERSTVLGNALVGMYAQCGALAQAQSVLNKLPSRDVISWSALIAGYAQMEQGQQALECFDLMQREGIPPDSITYLSILKACAVLGAINKGKKIHDEISRQGLLQHSIELGNALVDMYAKCGALSQAQSILHNLIFRDIVSWNALIAGCAQEGQVEQALLCFEQMQLEGVIPDLVTFLCLLNLCSHLGLVEEGQELFDSMEAKYGLKPNVECFTCMVDLLGRAGHLVKAVTVIEEMPSSTNSAIWLCLLGACQKWADVNVGTWAFEQAIKLDKCDGAAYISMVNIFAAAGMAGKAEGIEAMQKQTKHRSSQDVVH